MYMKKRTRIALVCIIIILSIGAILIFSLFKSQVITETSVNYIDKTFMKERILSGAVSGDFSTDGYIKCSKEVDSDQIPSEPVLSRDAYSDITFEGVAAIELRYRYPFEMIQKDETGKEYTTWVNFDYDYILSGSIEYRELNSLIESYITAFEAIFKNASFEELIQEDDIYSLLEQCKKYVDNNDDARVCFRFFLSGIGGDALITVPHERMAELNTFD